MLGEKKGDVEAFHVFAFRAKLLFPAHMARLCQVSSDTFRAHAASASVYVSINGGGDKMFTWLGDLVSHIVAVVMF